MHAKYIHICMYGIPIYPAANQSSQHVFHAGYELVQFRDEIEIKDFLSSSKAKKHLYMGKRCMLANGRLPKRGLAATGFAPPLT